VEAASSEIAQLIEPIRTRLAQEAGTVGLDLERVHIEPILNWGGFVNRSFRASDGNRTLSIKLTSDPLIKRGLETWRALAALLEQRYHAPRMVGWLDLAPFPFCGPMFEWLDGTVATELDSACAGEISTVVTRLHADAEVAHRLSGPVRTCAQAYLDAYHERFTEDLSFIETEPPPFVDRQRLAWLRDQVRLLETRVRQSTSFRQPAHLPVHGDLWLNNILIDPTGHWYLLDWDGLALGDPVIDWTMLFGPSREHPEAAVERVVLAHVALNAEERQRLAIYTQASQLDWVIDPLSDWVQARHEPEHGASVRVANERIHKQALEIYHARYGS
jgi:hypothetical protein